MILIKSFKVKLMTGVYYVIAINKSHAKKKAYRMYNKKRKIDYADFLKKISYVEKIC